MADTGTLGDRAQRESFDPLFRKFHLSRLQKSRPKVAVVIGFFRHTRGLAPHLVSVKIFLDGATIRLIILTL
jgi:hypothetical protein